MDLKNVFEDILTQVNNNIGYARVWNNQLNLLEQQTMYMFPNQATFVEIILQKTSLSLGVNGGDITIRFHIVSVQYDAQDGTLEQNLEVFGRRDAIIQLFQYYEPVKCSGMQLVNEEPDYTHSNVYHYQVDFICSFVDETGYINRDKILKDPPTDLEVTGTIQ